MSAFTLSVTEQVVSPVQRLGSFLVDLLEGDHATPVPVQPVEERIRVRDLDLQLPARSPELLPVHFPCRGQRWPHGMGRDAEV